MFFRASGVSSYFFAKGQTCISPNETISLQKMARQCVLFVKISISAILETSAGVAFRMFSIPILPDFCFA